MTTFIIILLLIIINIFTVYKLLFRILFNDMDDFKESIRFMFTPDAYSLFKGEYIKDRIAQAKLGIFVVLSVLITVVEYNIVDGLLIKLFN